MTYKEIEVEDHGPVRWVYLSRPEQLNTLTATMIGELCQAFRAAATDAGVGVVVISGRGRGFCAGADLKDTPSPEVVRSGKRTFFDISDELAELLTGYPRPLLAALNGVTCAGGLEMALFADVVFAARNTKIGDVHSNFGLMPGLGGAVRLTRAVGPQRARMLMFSGDLIPADEAAAWGLVAKVVEPGELQAQVQAFAERLAGKSRKGLLKMRALVEDSFDASLDNALRLERVVFREYYQSPEVLEGQSAFREKRSPDFRSFWTKSDN